LVCRRTLLADADADADADAGLLLPRERDWARAASR
jgi:hypothetical protein